MATVVCTGCNRTVEFSGYEGSCSSCGRKFKIDKYGLPSGYMSQTEDFLYRFLFLPIVYIFLLGLGGLILIGIINVLIKTVLYFLG